MASTSDTPSGDPLWREALAPYTRPRPSRTALDILTQRAIIDVVGPQIPAIERR